MAVVVTRRRGRRIRRRRLILVPVRRRRIVFRIVVFLVANTRGLLDAEVVGTCDDGVPPCRRLSFTFRRTRSEKFVRAITRSYIEKDEAAATAAPEFKLARISTHRGQYQSPAGMSPIGGFRHSPEWFFNSFMYTKKF